MPVAAKQYDPEFEVHTTAAKPVSRRRDAAHASSAAHWNQWETLVNHFGPAVAEPVVPDVTPRRAPKRNPKPKGRHTEDIQLTPRQATKHRPFRLAPAALIMWSTVTGLLIALLAIHGATLSLSQQEVDVAKNTKIAREAIDNTNKSIAAIQISPEMAQWALTHGWHVAEQADFDEIPMQAEAGGQR